MRMKKKPELNREVRELKRTKKVRWKRGKCEEEWECYYFCS